MGNVASLARASSALDSYVAELGTDISYEKSLSSSRFLKTILVRHANGLLVVKLFIKPDPSVDLRIFQRRLKHQRDALADLSNVLTYQTFVETDKAGYMIRQWAGSSLYDRISTRPYLAGIEKKWIAFQLLSGLRDARARDVSHGDLKSENILITPCLSVLITDFASCFKPTHLPLNDPSDFSYFYDSSGRRTCYIAPERFFAEDSKIAEDKRAAAAGGEVRSSLSLGGGKKDGKVTEAMDVFSAGCVLAEMWTDGSGVFTLSELFAYREGKSAGLESVLSGLEDKSVETMISSMLSLSPTSRPSFERLLSDYRNIVFPEHFYSFLPDYFNPPQRNPLAQNQNLGKNGMTPAQKGFGRADDVIAGIVGDWEGRVKVVLEEGSQMQTGLGGEDGQPGHGEAPTSTDKTTIDGDGPALLLLNIITADIRNCVRPSSRIAALGPLLDLCRFLSDEDVLDRIVPFVVVLLTDEAPQVRAESCRILTSMLSTITSVTPANVDVMPDYILPHVRHLVQDDDVLVRCAYAECLGTLAEVSMSFLEMSQALRGEDGRTAYELEGTQLEEPDYDTSVQDLQTIIEEQAGTLLLDASSDVKRATLTSIIALCLFFGRHRTNEIVLSRMITYLNDQDWRLRYSFLESVVSVAAFVGSTSLEEFVLPLMEQALADTEDFVVARVLASLASLTELGLFSKARIWELISNAYGFLCHPSPWVRQSAAAFLAVATKHLPSSDVWCIVYPYIRPLLDADVREITELSLLDVVSEPLQRPIMEAARVWATQSMKSPFWSTARTPRSSSIGKGVFKMAPPPPSRLPTMSLEQDEVNLKVLRDRGLKPEDDYKFGALRDHIATQAVISMQRGEISRPVPQLSQSFAGDVVGLQNLDVTPQTVFISPHRSERVVKPSSFPGSGLGSRRGSAYSARPPRPRLMSEDSTASDAHPLGELRRRLGALEKSSPKASSASSITSSVVIPSSAVPPATIGSSSPVGSLGSTIIHSHNHAHGHSRPSKARISVGKAESVKASPEVSAVKAVAIGHMEQAKQMRLDEEGSHSGRSTPIATPVGHSSQDETSKAAGTNGATAFMSSYEGQDPDILDFLKEVYTSGSESTAPLAEFGPVISTSTKKRQSQRVVSNAARSSTTSSRLSPNLIAQLSHSGDGILDIIVSPDHLFFATISGDGQVLVWDIGRLEKSVSKKPRLSYRCSGRRINAACLIEASHCIALATDDGVEVIRIFTSTSSSGTRYNRIECVKRIEMGDVGGHIVCIRYLRTSEGSSNLLYATSTGSVVLYDLRTSKSTLRMQNPVQLGRISDICIDKRYTWVGVSTANGYVSIQDLRFGLLLRTWSVPGSITALRLHPTRGRGKWIVVATDNDPSGNVPLLRTFDVTTGALVEAFYSDASLTKAGPAEDPNSNAAKLAAGATPASRIASLLAESATRDQRLGASAVEQHQAPSVLALLSLSNIGTPRTNRSGLSPVAELTVDRSRKTDGDGKGCLVTAGQDRVIRLWDMANMADSLIVSGSGRASDKVFGRLQSTAEGVDLYGEQTQAPTSSRSSSTSRVFKTAVQDEGDATGTNVLRPHFDAITALAALETPYSSAMVIVSGDRSGSIKVWRMENDG